MYAIKEPSSYTFEKVGIKGKVFPIKTITQKSGVCFIETENGHSTVIVNDICDVFYSILKGKGYFEINGKKENFSKTDLIVIPARSKFTYKGKCKMLRFTTPAFYPEQEETIL